MLDLQRVATALAAKKDLFGRHAHDSDALLHAYGQRWLAAARLTGEEIDARLAGFDWPGARPTAEHSRQTGAAIEFPERWQNHEQARAWARRTLVGVPTFAVDGSQILPSREFYPPVGAVQIGWFENLHRPDGRYVKDVSFEVLSSAELGDDIGDGDEPGYRSEAVNWRRFQGECRRLIDYMRGAKGRQPAPVCFFDGSLVVSFAQHMLPEHQARYVQAVTELLAVSAECHVPLIGYVDTSYAADLATMLDSLSGERLGMVADGAFLRPLMPQWGSRTPAWLCARNAPLKAPGGNYYSQVGFVYLKTTAANPPARLEFPRWLVDEGQLDRVIDIVRAECVIGNGYPYAVETADAVAVITMQDRERFFAAFQRFAAREGLPLRFSRKAGSKLGRR